METDTKIYMGDKVMTPFGEGKFIGYGADGDMQVWVREHNQLYWFNPEELQKV